MLLPSVAPFRRHRLRKPASTPPPPPAPLTLVAATYDDASLLLMLTFDRPVNVAAFDGSAVVVGDPTFNHTAYDGTGGPAYLAGPAVVGVYLAATGEYFGTEVDLTVSGASGIVAADDGGAWPGTPGTVFLPYP